jgi:TP901 family phage tail tape measure protein
MPGSELAEAFVRLRVDSNEVKKDVQKGIVGADATPAGRKAGQSYGSGFASSAASEIKKNAGKIAAVGTAAVVGVGIASIKMAGDFQAGMTRLVTSAGEVNKNLGLVSAGVLKLAVSTGTSTEQLSTGLYTVESAGFHAADGLTVLKAAAQGARAENASLATVTDAVTTVLTDYHLKAGDATKVTSALVATVASGKTNMELLSGALSRVLPTAAALHVSFPQIAGDIATLTAHGVSARLATQDLNSVLVALSAPSDKAAKAMKIVGLTSAQVSEDVGKKGLTATLQELSTAFLQTAGPGGQLLLATLKGLPPAAQGAANAFLAGTISTKQLNKATADLSPLQQNQIKSFVKISSSATGLKENYVAAMTAMLGGTRGLGVALQLTGANAKTAAGDTKTIAAAYSTGAKNVAGWDDIQKTFNFRLSQFKEEAETTAISLGTKLLPAATSTIGFFSQHEGALTATAAGLLAVVGSVTALAIAIKGVQVISTVYGAIAGGAAALKGFSAAAVAAAGVQKGLSAATAIDTATTVAFAVAADGTTTAVTSMTIAEKAAAITGAALAAVDPLVWAAAAVVAVAALTVALFKFGTNTSTSTKALQDQFKATGYNIAGYQKLAQQAGNVSSTVTALGGTVQNSAGKAVAAKGSFGAYGTAVQEVGVVTDQARTKGQNLVLGLSQLQVAYGITQKQAIGLATKAGVTATQFAASGQAGLNAQTKVFAWAQTTGKATVAADQFANATSGMSQALNTMSNGLLATQGNELGFISAQQQATTAIKGSTSGLDGNSAAAVAARQATLQATDAAVQLASSQLNLQHNSKAAATTLQNQISFLQATGDKSKFVTDEIDALKTALAGLKAKTIPIIVHGDGTFSVQGNAVKARAAGGLITGGTPGRDSVLAALMPGEVVVPVPMVNAGAVDHLRGRLPGFAAGGIVPTYSGAPAPGEASWITGDYNATVAIIEQATAAATAKAVAAAKAKAVAAAAASSAGAAGVPGAGGGNAGANQSLAQSMAPQWSSGTQWADWVALWNRESGWNQYAKNPSSGAYGIPQALPASKMGAAANPPQSNPHAQISWGIGYISGRYGSPMGAWAHEQASGWYAKGTGGAAPGWGVVGERGPELVGFHGGETVLPHSMTNRVLSGTIAMPGYATGTKPKPLTPAQKLKNQRLAELAKLVTLAAKQTTARNKTITARTLTVDAQELYDLQHPKDKAGPKKLASLRKSLAAYAAASAKPINTEHAEIRLLRSLTGMPLDKKYGGPGPAPKPAPDDTSTDDTTDTGTGDTSTTAAAAPPKALPIPTFLAGAGGEGGFVAPGVSASSGLGGQSLGPAVGVTGGVGPAVPAMAGAAPAGGSDFGLRELAGRLEIHLRQLTQVSASAPIGAAQRFADTMNGAARGARQRAAYSVVPGI